MTRINRHENSSRSERSEEAHTMPHVDAHLGPDAYESHLFDRRTLVVSAVGAFLAAALRNPARAAHYAVSPRSVASTQFDPALAHRLQQVLDDVVAGSRGSIPGVILHAERAGRGSWSGTAGLGRLDPDVAIRPGDRFPAGSVVKPFVSATVLQLVERGRFTLDAALPDVLPADVAGRFPSASEITVRMLLGHRSGLPDWSTAATDAAAARDPGRVWKVSEFLDLAAAKKPMFAPGARYAYSNTNYTLLGLVIEHASGRSWRQEVTDRVIRPLGLGATVLPAPGNRSATGPYAHGYMEVNGKLLDASTVDPSMAGTAGGHALVTTVGDLVRFFDGLLAGRLFRHRETLKAMLTFKPAHDPSEPGQVGYGFGLMRRVLPGGIETIDHLGGAGGYYAYVARLPRQQLTFAAAMNSSANPSLLLLPVIRTLANAHS
jgi:D-alanyl-D-alanine carboxypeptidase